MITDHTHETTLMPFSWRIITIMRPTDTVSNKLLLINDRKLIQPSWWHVQVVKFICCESAFRHKKMHRALIYSKSHIRLIGRHAFSFHNYQTARNMNGVLFDWNALNPFKRLHLVESWFISIRYYPGKLFRSFCLFLKSFSLISEWNSLDTVNVQIKKKQKNSRREKINKTKTRPLALAQKQIMEKQTLTIYGESILVHSMLTHRDKQTKKMRSAYAPLSNAVWRQKGKWKKKHSENAMLMGWND